MSTVNDGRWHSVVAIFKEPTERVLYVDGRRVHRRRFWYKPWTWLRKNIDPIDKTMRAEPYTFLTDEVEDDQE